MQFFSEWLLNHFEEVMKKKEKDNKTKSNQILNLQECFRNSYYFLYMIRFILLSIKTPNRKDKKTVFHEDKFILGNHGITFNYYMTTMSL